MAEAFDAACEKLGDIDQPEVAREVIAGRIIATARLGERDPARLLEAALRKPDRVICVDHAQHGRAAERVLHFAARLTSVSTDRHRSPPSYRPAHTSHDVAVVDTRGRPPRTPMGHLWLKGRARMSITD
jgi:hypothetical protein